MRAQKFALIINPYAKQVRKKYLAPNRCFWEALLAPEEYVIPDGADKVRDVIAKLLDREVTSLGIIGGDGTVHLVLSELLKLNPGRLPTIIPFRGGTINALCNNLGNRDAPEDTLKKFLGVAPGHAIQTYKHLLRIEEHAENHEELRFGFSFANGVLVKAYNEYYQSQNPGLGSALKIIMKLLSTGMISFGSGPGMLSPVGMKVQVPGQLEREGKFNVVVASVLDNPTLWWKPFGVELNGHPVFHYLVNSMGTRELAWNMLDLFVGKANHPLHAVGQTRQVKVESDGGYILDGEVFGLDQKLSIQVTLGPALKFLSV